VRKIFVLLTAFLILQGCSLVGLKTSSDEDKVRAYSKTEILLSDFSKKITAYYEKQGLSIPTDFDEKMFIEVLKKTYPDQSKVEFIRDSYKIRAHSIENEYSVMLCDSITDKKLMEDFSCDLSNVEIRYWDKEDFHPCKLEEDWRNYCK
jgi:hypothetical protein